ncbi:MAG TPA: aldo/keto reductase [Candidatus Sulfotelmatobacter sp.]|nr:aldo/keto reductase [Candidatus Sulfotelmatobacter sp.]
MIERRFGFLEREVPVIGQGTWNVPTRGAGAEEAKRALRRGIELGMVHIDTAEMYGDGASERLIGEAIRGVPRDQLFLVSKLLPTHARFSTAIQHCEQSLQRLGTDYLDCYLLHWRGSVPLAETLGAFEQLVADGKILSLGVSNFDVDDLEEAQAALTRERIACNQVLYHLGERTIEAHELPWCRAHNVAIVAYTPFGRGDWTDAPGVHTLDTIARKHHTSPRAVILAFLTRDPIVFAVPKASTIPHVEENAAAGELELDGDDIIAIERAFPVRARRGGIPTL